MEKSSSVLLTFLLIGLAPNFLINPSVCVCACVCVCVCVCIIYIYIYE